MLLSMQTTKNGSPSTPMTIDDLAVLINNGFQSMQDWFSKELETRLSEGLSSTKAEILSKVALKSDLEAVKIELGARLGRVETGLGDVAQRLVHIENLVEDIKLADDGRAYRFEAADLDRRVVKVEEKLGIEPPPVRVPY